MGNGINLKAVKDTVAKIVSSQEIHNIVFVGCGASSAELYPAFYILKDETKKLRSFFYTASEFNHDTPLWLGKDTLVVTASLGGNTPETVNANTIAKEHGAITVSITHTPGSPLTKEADYLFIHGFEENYAAKLEKMGYAMDLALELMQQTEGYKYYDLAIEGFEKIFDLSESAAQHAKSFAAEFGCKFKDVPVTYVMSSGASMKVAYSTSICLMMEMQWLNSGSFHSGEFFHGPFEITDKDVPFILFMNEGKTRDVDARALTFLDRFQAKTAVIDTKDYGLSSYIKPEVVTYFNPFVHTAVFRTYAEALSEARQHPLTLRRYMWKLSY
jgi:fructoselysine-6-P-deglycase FrlB-like protein